MPMHYYPIPLSILLLLVLVFVFLIILVEVRILKYAYEKIGINRRYIFLLLFGSLFGSYFNIPIYQLGPEKLFSGSEIDFFGMHYVIPMVKEWAGPVVAVNLGGAVIPTLLSIHLLFKNKLYFQAIIGIALVTAVVHKLSYLVPGLGIAEPIFVPPLVSSVAALFLSWRSAPALAYISGTIGTLIGADLLNLGKLSGLGAPVVSIGGAGTFDGIFLTGIVSVLLASVFSRHGAGGETPPFEGDQ